MILYFSATGNSKHVTERIAHEGEKIIRMDMAIKNNEFEHEITDGRIGIVTPTYHWTMPSITSEFLSKVVFNYESKPYIFLIATYGTTTGSHGQMANNILKKKGYEIDAYYDIKMPDTWTPIFDLSNKEHVASLNVKAENQIDATKKLIEEKRTGDFRDDKAPLFTGQCGKAIYDAYSRKTKHLSVTSDCIGCGVCAKKCPVDAIEMREKRPVWVKDKCAMCLGCLHRCPKFAIECGGNTSKHGQYIHPDTSSAQL